MAPEEHITVTLLKKKSQKALHTLATLNIIIQVC